MSFLKNLMGATLAFGLASAPAAFADAGKVQGQGQVKKALQHKIVKVRIVKAKQAKQAKQFKNVQKPLQLKQKVQQKQVKKMLKQVSQKKD